MTNIRYDYFRNLYTEILNKYFPVKERYARANPVLFKTKELNKVILKQSTPCNIFQNQTNYDGYWHASFTQCLTCTYLQIHNFFYNTPWFNCWILIHFLLKKWCKINYYCFQQIIIINAFNFPFFAKWKNFTPQKSSTSHLITMKVKINASIKCSTWSICIPESLPLCKAIIFSNCYINVRFVSSPTHFLWLHVRKLSDLSDLLNDLLSCS